MNKTLEKALHYAKHGVKVFPVAGIRGGKCDCPNKVCASPGKHPHAMAPNGFKDGTTDAYQIRAWWGIDPNANIGIVTGDPYVVIDVDPRHHGLESLAALEEQLQPLPPTTKVLTGGDGFHYYFEVNGTPVSSRVGWLPGIDVKSAGGYVVAPPSTHISGKTYRFDKDSPKPAPLPEWLAAEINKEPPAEDRVDMNSILAGVPEGQRDKQLFKYAAKLRHDLVPEDVALQLVLDAASRCQPPFDEKVARRKVKSVYKKYPAGATADNVKQFKRPESSPATVPPSKTSPIPKPALYLPPAGGGDDADLLKQFQNDAGNADRVIARYGKWLRYCHPFKKWLAWVGTHWQPDGTKTAARWAKETMAEYHRQAVAAGQEGHSIFAKRSLNSRAVRDLLESAEK